MEKTHLDKNAPHKQAREGKKRRQEQKIEMLCLTDIKLQIRLVLDL